MLKELPTPLPKRIFSLPPFILDAAKGPIITLCDAPADVEIPLPPAAQVPKITFCPP